MRCCFTSFLLFDWSGLTFLHFFDVLTKPLLCVSCIDLERIVMLLIAVIDVIYEAGNENYRKIVFDDMSLDSLWRDGKFLGKVLTLLVLKPVLFLKVVLYTKYQLSISAPNRLWLCRSQRLTTAPSSLSWTTTAPALVCWHSYTELNC